MESTDDSGAGRNSSQVKLFVMIPRAPKVSVQEFHDHWRHPHGSLGRDIPGIRDIVQSHQLHSDRLPADQAYFEGIGEAWFESIGESLGMAEDHQYKTHVQPDEVNFIDLPKLEYLFADEEILVDRATVQDGVRPIDANWHERHRPTSIKLLQFVRSDGNPRWATDRDAELGAAIGALRHVRSRPSREAYGDEPSYLGVRELWWPTLWDFEQGVASSDGAWNEILGLGGASALTLLAHAERWPEWQPEAR